MWKLKCLRSIRLLILLLAMLLPAAVAEAGSVRGHSYHGGHSHGSHSGWYGGYGGYYGRGYGYGYYGYGYPYYGYGYAYAPYYYGGYYPGYPVYSYPYAPSVAYVDTDIYPEETAVFVDGKPVGTTDDFDGFPGYLQVTPGKHQLTFKAEGRAVMTRTLRVPRGALVQLDFTLPKLGDARPSDPKLEEDIELPEAPDSEAGIEPGQGNIEMDEPGDPPNLKDEDADDQDDYGADVEDEEGDDADDIGFLKIDIEPGDASVYLDGKLLGAASKLSGLHGEMRVEPGTHKIEAVRPGYRSVSKRVEIEAGDHQTVSLDLQKRPPASSPPR